MVDLPQIQKLIFEPDPNNPNNELKIIRKDDNGNSIAEINFGSGINNAIRFGVPGVPSGTEYMRVHTNGNVGIGTTGPNHKLEVAKDISSAGDDAQIVASGLTNANKGLALGFDTSNDVGFIYVRVKGLGAKNLVLGYPGGNIGIGTTTPQNKLDVEGGAVIGAGYSGTNTAPANGLLVEGNIGIGTPTPQNKLDVEGGAVIGAGYSGTNTAPANGLLVEGNVGIGKWPNDENKLDVNGKVNATSFAGEGSGLTNLNASNMNIGTLSINRLPEIDASKITTGTFTQERIPSLSASKITGGTINGDLNVNGNVGIGTSNPRTTLHLAGPEVEPNPGTGLQIGDNRTIVDDIAENNFHFKNSFDFSIGYRNLKLYQGDYGDTSRELLTVLADGRVGIGTSPGTGNKLDVNGKVNATSFAGDGSGLTSLDATKMNSGTLSIDRIPNLDASKISGKLTADQIPNLDASKIIGKLTAGQIPDLAASKIIGLDQLSYYAPKDHPHGIVSHTHGASEISTGTITGDLSVNGKLTSKIYYSDSTFNPGEYIAAVDVKLNAIYLVGSGGTSFLEYIINEKKYRCPITGG